MIENLYRIWALFSTSVSSVAAARSASLIRELGLELEGRRDRTWTELRPDECVDAAAEVVFLRLVEESLDAFLFAAGARVMGSAL